MIKMSVFTCEKITERIIRIRCPGNVFAFLALGDKKAALIDTGFGVYSLKEYVETLTDRPLTVLLTHGHYDHAGGAGEFEQVLVDEKDISLAVSTCKKERRMAGLGPDAGWEDMITDPAEEQFLTFACEEEFDLGGLRVKMLPLAGHTAGSYCPLFVEERTVLLGDACNSAAYMQLNESLPVREYMKNLEIFRDRYEDLYDTVLYSHPHNFGGKEIIEEMIDLCRQVLEPGFADTCTEASPGSGVLYAKPINDAYAPLDGSCANLLFTREKL